jgi:CheY-like chemotaxis protein
MAFKRSRVRFPSAPPKSFPKERLFLTCKKGCSKPALANYLDGGRSERQADNFAGLIQICGQKRPASRSRGIPLTAEIDVDLPLTDEPEPTVRRLLLGMIAALLTPMDTKKVLVVEDHPDCRGLVKIVLSRLGYVVVEAGTGQEALERVSESSFDLIVMDFGLPGMTGDKLIMRFKGDPSTARIPVIVTTGYMDTQVAKRAIAAGAESLLLKPYDMDELVDAINRCLSPQPDREPLLTAVVADQLAVDDRRYLDD